MKKNLYGLCLLIAMFSFRAGAQTGTSYLAPLYNDNISLYASYSNTQSNTDLSLGPQWLAGDKIWYAFNILTTGTIQITNCGSYMNTYISLLDTALNELGNSEGNSYPSPCEVGSTMRMVLAPGTYYVAVNATSRQASGNIATSLALVSEGGIPYVPVKNATLTGVWSLQSDNEKKYINNVLQRDTTISYSAGEAGLVFDGDNYSFLENNIVRKTGIFNSYNRQILVTDDDTFLYLKVKEFDPANGVLVVEREQVFVDENNLVHREVIESQFIRAAN